MSWTRLTSISVTNGSAIVAVNSGSTINIKVGDALLIGGFDLVEIEGVFANQLQLGSNWNHATQSNVAAAIVPTFGDFNHAVEEIRKLRQATTDNLDAMEQWWTKPEGSVVFQSYDGKQFEARSVQQMEKDVTEIEERAESMMTDINAWGFARTEADMIADRERNNQLFAASGHIHSGKTFATGYTPINEGMFVRTNPVVEYENQFFIGCPNSTAVGSSETNHPVFNLSGITVALRGINQTKSWVENIFKLPPAPKGTEVYDSATGVLTNFETDVDPKYGDVAADSDEAVARAFEGLAKNGNLRLGDTLWEGPTGRGTRTIQDGLCTITDTTGVGMGGSAMWAAPKDLSLVAGETYVIELFVESITPANIGWVRLGYYSDPNVRNERLVEGLNRFEFTAGVSNSIQGMIVYAGGNGTVVFSSLSIRKKSTAVVINPVDLVGVELFLRPINEADPFAYPYGIQQSKLTSVDGIPTVENTVRPITHFEMYPGDTTSRGRGFNLLDGSLSAAQKAKVFQKKHKIYRMNDGTLAQWTASARVFRGAGNRDWVNIGPSTGHLLSGSNSGIKKGVNPRGMLDDNKPFSDAAAIYLGTNANAELSSAPRQKGMFATRFITYDGVNYSNNVAINGECYFYVIATVPRLNQGAYHPTLNPMGTKMCNTVGISSTGSYWYDPNSLVPFTVSECFKQIDATSDSTTRGAALSTGAISSSYSGHPNNLRFNAICASGQGGVIDERLKYGAWDASSPEQAAVVREEVNNGTLRGRERLVMTRITQGDATGSNGKTFGIYVASDRIQIYSNSNYLSQFALGDKVHIYHSGLGLIYTGLVTIIRADNIWVANATEATGGWTGFGSAVNDASMVYVIHESPNGNTVEGEFFTQTVYGSPNDLQEVNLLKYGWPGIWGGIPADSKMPLGRPSVNSVAMNYSKSTDKGDTWTSGTGVVKNDANETNIALGAGAVYIFPYKALANPTVLSTNTAVHHAESGLPRFVDVFSSADVNYGAHLGYSLFNFTLKGSAPDTARQRLALTEVSLDYQGVLSSGDNGLQCQKHAPVGVLDSSNDTPACKVMMYQTSKSGMASLNIVANELRFDAVSESWSDDSKMKVKNGSFTDLANASCLAVIHELSNPYGFIKNKN
ncbi:hypothetical protein [Vibrio furnissii]|uniref:hypothetical protein n=1 Tax=Vibrio furnissii TaxID=29494 RepID=UPI001EEB83F3|nr:hypothetical protein [Vibrio furnissii]MCG6233118.1 hypothetical protein [Vibrio furnissii]MCG6258928.1 hypothetical protein [Vibrio furnissii]